MRKHLFAVAAALLSFISGAAGISTPSAMRVEPIGYRVGTAGAIADFASSVATVSPDGVSTVAANKQMTLTAALNGDYKVVCWQKFAVDPRVRENDPLEEFGTDSKTVTVGYDPNVKWMYVVVVVDYNLKVRADVSSFGKGTVTVSPMKESYAKGDQVTLDVQPEKGYQFVRWSDGNADHLRKLALDKSVDLKAYVEPTSSRVTFSPGEGATVGVTEKRVSYGSPYGTLPVPTKVGSVFSGWADNEKRTVTEKTEVDRAVDHVLTAVWEISPASYTVVFDANGGTGKQIRVSQAFEVGVPQKLRINTFYKSGSVFIGWNQNADAEEKQYSDEQIVQDLAPAGASLTLFAVWRAEKVAYTVRFDKNADDATGTMTDQQFAGGEQKPLSGCNFRRAGWTFLGWSTDSGALEATYQDREKVQDLTMNKELTLYAVWSKNPVYYVNYMKMNRDSEPWKSETVEQGKEYTLSGTNGLTRLGYAFVGWTNGMSKATYPAGKKCTTQELAKMVEDGDTIAFVAVWKPITYTIKFDGNGGECTRSKDNPTPMTYDDLPKQFEIHNPNAIPSIRTTRDGYDLVGWGLDPFVKDEKLVMTTNVNVKILTITNNLTAVDGTNVTLYAIWKLDTPIPPPPVTTNTVTFKTNDFVYVTEKVKCGETVTKPGGPTPPKGYTFKCWSETEGGSAFNFATSITNDLELYAVWEEASGDPLRVALGLDQEFDDKVSVSAEGAWTVVGEAKDKKGLNRTSTSPNGQLRVRVPAAGTLRITFAPLYESGAGLTVTMDGDPEPWVEDEPEELKNHGLETKSAGTFVFSGNPSEGAIWTLKNFSWEPAVE